MNQFGISILMFIIGSIIGFILKIFISDITNENLIILPNYYEGRFYKLKYKYSYFDFVCGIGFLFLYLKFNLSLKFFIYLILFINLIIINVVYYRNNYIQRYILVTIIIISIISLLLESVFIGYLCILNMIWGAVIPAILVFISSLINKEIKTLDVWIIFITGMYLGLALNLLNLLIGILLAILHIAYMSIFDSNCFNHRIVLSSYFLISTFVIVILGNNIIPSCINIINI